MKSSCLILGALILVAITTVCIMVKFATDISVDQKRLDDDPYNANPVSFRRYSLQGMGIISLSESTSYVASLQFPYVGAITRNSSNYWTFACFASVILVNWIVTSAHCRWPGNTHRFLLFHDMVRNYTHTYQILYWKAHERYNSSSCSPGSYDIAVAKLNLDTHPLRINHAIIDGLPASDNLMASVWKTVATMDRRTYLTNDFDRYNVKIVNSDRCRHIYKINLDESLMCVDMSDYDDCFMQDFGPIFMGNKVAGVSALLPSDCETKLAVFTNVSYYNYWILNTTATTWFI